MLNCYLLPRLTKFTESSTPRVNCKGIIVYTYTISCETRLHILKPKNTDHIASTFAQTKSYKVLTFKAPYCAVLTREISSVVSSTKNVPLY